ncbi:MAG TPA: hypothetical protein VEZ20_00480 [Allosphingosinicella sp.]|jgi:hypothetical protein|nr:hypothetical protein [Allosphingosinicella sp.]
MHLSLLGVLALAGLAAPSCAKPQARCAAPAAGWDRYDPGHPPEHRIGFRAILRTNGSIAWDGTAISEDQLIHYLARARTMDPAPYLVLRREPGVTCERLRQIRELFTRHAGCGRDGVCSEAPTAE